MSRSSGVTAVGAAITLIVLFTFGLPGGASAATTIGQLDPGTPTGSCVGGTYWVQNTSVGPSYTVPANGVVTSWRHKPNTTSDRELGLRIFRLVSGTTYTLVGSSGVQTLGSSPINSFTTRIPVKAGDRLGLYVGNPGLPLPGLSGGASCAFSTGIGDLIHEGPANPEPAVGANIDLPTSYSNIYRLNVTASVEADVDGDGYGDETQDGCTTNPAAQGTCPVRDGTPPRATISSKRDSVKDNAVSIAVTSDEIATATATGSVRVPNASRLYRLMQVTASLRQGASVQLKLRIPKKARRPIKRALRRHRKLKARITIVLKDPAGNATTVKSAVPLRR
jgi:hypothetical protein